MTTTTHPHLGTPLWHSAGVAQKRHGTSRQGAELLTPSRQRGGRRGSRPSGRGGGGGGAVGVREATGWSGCGARIERGKSSCFFIRKERGIGGGNVGTKD